ncbi:MAG: OsmC family protein [Candidatus Promineifilaceae bacterium]|nr:OsmC family protein [Candidatus Promineifilaceae bacterium]
MKATSTQNLATFLTIVIVIFLSGCQPTVEPAGEEDEQGSPLATARVSAQRTEPGRATVTAHNDLQYVVEESPSPDSLDQIDTLLAAQSTCAVFVAEKAAEELDVKLTGATATAAFDEEAQQVRVFLDLPGVDDEEVLALANNLRQRCPIYTTLARAGSVDFTPGEQFELPTSEAEVVRATLAEFGRANVTAQNQAFVMDSVPPLDGPNVELNPLDLMLGGLAACGTFAIDEIEQLANANVVVEGDLDPSGVRDLEGENPRIQAMRIIVEADGAPVDLSAEVEDELSQQCHLYQTLNGTVNISILTEPTK